MTICGCIIIFQNRKEPTWLDVNLVKKIRKKAKVGKLADKLMTIVFWDSHFWPIVFQKVSMWIQCTAARSYISWANIHHKRSDLGMSTLSSCTIVPTHILLSSLQRSSMSLIVLFFRIPLICLIWHPAIFDYACPSKISWVASILQIIYR